MLDDPSTPVPTRHGVARGVARFAGVRASEPVECVDLRVQPERLATGFWVVVGDFEGRVRAWRFARVDRDADRVRSLDGAVGEAFVPGDDAGATWRGPEPDSWRSTTSRDAYEAGVADIRARIREGDVYQVNLCRVLEAPLAGPDGAEPSALALAVALGRGNPAPHAGVVHVPAGGDLPPIWVVSASPELYLRVADGVATSGPIKGTAPTADGLTEKDRAENVMIADMVRNDLQRVCEPGSVEVTALLAVEQHPGLVHLVTRVQGRLRPGRGWGDLLDATYPPASVSGAPKHAALGVIDELEPSARGPYCGAFGWVDGDSGTAELAVAIRTFWWTADGAGHEAGDGTGDRRGGGTLRFGTGAGVTWGSDPASEWAETELKAARLVALASGAPVPAGAPGPGRRDR
ncbi:chorismate-binding protein [Actinotalea ferrariae]|uniref:chorismate-binding protein n=1 Tax=Actinotalea ferrariae TaxID=1386098 RepID=UPI001C8C16AE|nr:chorismate-binding protein [Actinotalea ferrariae]MBX9246053.1 chorismate-binding protein [Actinotalea ferrariae]